MATKTMRHSTVGHSSPVMVSSPNTLTSISIEVLNVAMSWACSRTTWPTNTGRLKRRSSTKAVTQGLAAWRCAQMAPQRSTQAMICPPKTVPPKFACCGKTYSTMSVTDAVLGLGRRWLTVERAPRRDAARRARPGKPRARRGMRRVWPPA